MYLWGAEHEDGSFFRGKCGARTGDKREKLICLLAPGFYIARNNIRVLSQLVDKTLHVLCCLHVKLLDGLVAGIDLEREDWPKDQVGSARRA